MRIEAALVEAACNPDSECDAVPLAEMPAMSVDQKLHLLHMHKHQVRAIDKRPGLPERVATPEEVERALNMGLRRLESWMQREGEKGGP